MKDIIFDSREGFLGGGSFIYIYIYMYILPPLLLWREEGEGKSQGEGI